MISKEEKPFYVRLSESKNDFFRISFNNEYLSEINKYEKTTFEYRRAILCPTAVSVEKNKIDVMQYVKDTDKSLNFYIPFRHTNQNDSLQGLTICNTMNYAIFFAKKLPLLLTKNNLELWFNIGIGFFYETEFELIKEPEWDDDLTNFIKVKCGINASRKVYDEINDFRKYALNRKNLELTLEYNHSKTIKEENLIKFGIIFAALKHYNEKKFRLINKEEVIENSIRENNLENPVLESYTKVALRLENLCQKERIRY